MYKNQIKKSTLSFSTLIARFRRRSHSSSTVSLIYAAANQSFRRSRHRPHQSFIVSAAATFIASLKPILDRQWPHEKFTIKTTASTTTANANVQQILHNIERAKSLIYHQKYEEAKAVLRETLNLADECNDIHQVPAVYDMLVTIAIVEGNIMDAEEMLVRFIEKLIQNGYADTDNEIVRYKLKLCRLYQMVGNTQMAEIGYRSCVATQEAKCLSAPKDETGANVVVNVPDEVTQMLYMSALFWYARFLTEGNDLPKAKQLMAKALAQQKLRPVLQPTQMMVVLYHAAEIEFLQKDYAESVRFLTAAIELGASQAPDNIELPLFAVKLGVTFLFMRLYDKALYWCEQGERLARMYGNESAISEATLCMQKVREFDRHFR